MSLKDRIAADRSRVFMQENHFAEWHAWNGVKFLCVVDEDTALKRKNNNVNDISWDNNTIDTLIYVPQDKWPGRYPVPNERGVFDKAMMKILQVQNDMGMLAIVLSAQSPKAVAAE